ncbi:unnamed protein product, partial [Discosporangium mesarthrocarpum]
MPSINIIYHKSHIFKGWMLGISGSVRPAILLCFSFYRNNLGNLRSNTSAFNLGTRRAMSDQGCGRGQGNAPLDPKANSYSRPRVPISVMSTFGENLIAGLEAQALAKEVDEDDVNQKLVGDFVSKIYTHTNAALLYAHGGRLDLAQEEVDCAMLAVGSDLSRVDQLAGGVRTERVSGVLDALLRAKAFLFFLKTGLLLRKAGIGHEGFSVPEYLGGSMGLTMEIAKYATAQATILDRSSVLTCQAVLRALYGELMDIDYRNGPLRRKYDTVKYDVKRVDDILYELSLVLDGEGTGGSEMKRDGGGREGVWGEARAVKRP